MKKLVIDIDNTLCKTNNGDYVNSTPIIPVIEKLRQYKSIGFEIILHTSRNMRTYNGNIGKINSNTIPILVDWLKKNNIPYDELIVGKPWCGFDGFYVDDRAIRPSEFINNDLEQITSILKNELK